MTAIERDPAINRGPCSFAIARSVGAGGFGRALPHAVVATATIARRASTRYGAIRVVVSAPARAVTPCAANVVPALVAATETSPVTLNM